MKEACRILVVLYFFMSVAVFNTAHAHSGKETHTQIQISDDLIFAIVDLPWTVNEAARSYYHLRDGEQITDQETQQYIQSYVQKHFEIHKEGAALKTRSAQWLPQDHAHSLVIQLQFDYDEAGSYEVINDLLFNLNGHRQKNYCAIQMNDEQFNWVATADHPSFEIRNGAIQIDETATKEPSRIWIGGVLVLLVVATRWVL